MFELKNNRIAYELIELKASRNIEFVGKIEELS
jgi:hypothetical protein